MDTSESEKSDAESDDDYHLEATEDESPRTIQVKKRNSKTRNRFTVGSHSSNTNDQESLKLDSSGEGNVAIADKKTKLGVCCSCSKYSSCKTTKCQCRSSGEFCGMSCGCMATKCANRDIDKSQQSDMADGIANSSETNEADNDRLLASHGAMLLQSALVDKPIESNEDGVPRRKPLSDIGNTAVYLILTKYKELLSCLIQMD